jgi:DNA replication protein DnaC
MNVNPQENERNLTNRNTKQNLPICYVRYLKKKLDLKHYLNPDQLDTFKSIRDAFDQHPEKSVCVAVDSGPGTGKTYLVSVMLELCAQRALYIVYSRNLQHAMKQASVSVRSMTISSFLCRYFKVSSRKLVFYYG